MITTNKYNLPEAIFKAVSTHRPIVPNRYGITTLIAPPLIYALKVKHWDEIEDDASDKLWMLLGQSVHYILEGAGKTIDDAMSEEKIVVKYRGCEIVSISDLWKNGEISDYKITSVFSLLLGDKPEWTAQLNLNAWAYRQCGFHVNSLKIHAILRDWSKGKALSNPDWPRIPFQTVDLDVWSDADCQKFLDKCIDDIQAVPPRPCTPDEMWERPTTYAVKKNGRKTALRVLDTPEQAEQWKDENGGDIIEIRQGERTRCKEYCPVSQFCPYNIYKGQENEPSIQI